jgi:murein DD-endopeptidase
MSCRLTVLLTILVGIACARPATSTQRAAPIEARASIAPRPVRGGDQTHLVYELHITNLGRMPLTLRGISVSGPGATRDLASFSGDPLVGMIRRPGLAPDADDPDRIDGGMRAVVFMWVTLEDGVAVPDRLTHRISIANEDASVAVIEAPTVTVGPEAIAIGPPLRGGNWFAANGPDNVTGHRRAMIPLDGSPWIAQRFAIDWVQVLDNSTRVGDPEDNSNYHAWGQDVLAVADGVVASIHDGIPENVPGLNSRAVPITRETIGGNYIILDIGNGNYAFYAHLQPGSLRVGVGDLVRRGDVIGLVGNSGNSTEPHLHFHIGDHNAPLASEGLPYVFEEFYLQGRGRGRSLGGALEPLDPEQRRTGQLPMANELVRFTSRSSP